MTSPVTRVVDCPECHQLCGWCSWYRKNAREVGCGLRVNAGSGLPRTKTRCSWGEEAKGVACSTCDGSGKAEATTSYRQFVSGTLSISAELVVDRAGALAQKTSSQPVVTTTKNGNWETP
jgi:hypothetical protein